MASPVKPKEQEKHLKYFMMKQIVNCSKRIMEAGNHFKNRASKKSHTSKRKKPVLKKSKFLVILLVLSLSSCAVRHEKLKSDFVGFSDNIKTSYTFKKCIVKKARKQSPPYNLLIPSGKEQLEVSVLSLQQGRNTSAYYALDMALNRVEYVQKKYMEKDPDSRYYVVMLTDGLDNNSGHLAKTNHKGKYRKKGIKEIQDGYGDYLQQRMGNIMKKYSFFNLIKKPNTTNSFQSFVLLFKGKDIIESKYTDEQLSAMLKPFTGAQNPAIPPNPIISENFDTLLWNFSRELVSRSFDFDINKGYEGQRVRMQLISTQGDTVFIEGDFSKEGKYYRLNNIEFKSKERGRSSVSNNFTTNLKSTYLFGTTDKSRASVSFTVEDLKLNGYPFEVRGDKEAVSQWFYRDGLPRRNSEYDRDEGSKKNTYIILILDGSESFQENFTRAQNVILDIVEMIRKL